MEPRQNPNVQVDPFSRRWQRLVDRALDGALVPFLGSGISAQSKSPGEPGTSPKLPWMKARLADLLVERVLALAAKGRWPEVRAVLGALGVMKPCWPGPGATLDEYEIRYMGSELRHRCAQDTIPFDRLAEVVRALCGPVEPVRAIRVDALDGLLPLAAHRMLARLAREGLLTEIITTNWDTAIERAWRATFGDRPPPCGSRDEPFALATVLDLEDYRAHGSRRSDEDGRPVLHLYKINGCAGRWRRALASNCGDPKALADEANRVILTESQLHDFRKEHWARELLRDRTRRSALVFSGFGSDEAQIRYNVITLMEEFTRAAREDCDRRKPGAPIWDQPNALFVHAFEPALSYSQIQMLWAFWGSAGAEGAPMAGWDISDVNQFNGAELDELAPDPNPDVSLAGLSADLFWTRLYQAVIGRLVARRLESDGWSRWLRELGVGPGAVRGGILRWMYPPEEPALWRFGRLRRIWAEGSSSARTGDHTLAVMRWLAAMQGVRDLGDVKADPSAHRDWYQPLCERDLLVGLLLALYALWRAAGEGDDLDDWLGKIKPTVLGLRVPVPGRQNGAPAALWLVAEEHVPPSRASEAQAPETGGQVRVIVVPSMRAGPDLRAVCVGEDSKPVGRLRVCRMATAALEDVLPELLRPGQRSPMSALPFARAQRSARRARLREITEESQRET